MTERFTRFAVVVVAALTFVIAGPARAQDSSAAADSGHAWILRVAGATGAEACPCRAPALHVPHDRDLYIVGIGLRKILRSHGADGAELAYDLQLLPLVLSRGTADENLTIRTCGTNTLCVGTRSTTPWTTQAVGFGVLPLGFTALAPIVPRLRFQLRGAAGAVRLSKPVPLLQGRKFNFLAEASTVFELRLSNSLALTAGMVFNHISNGGTAYVNPGMNSRMIEFGLVRR